MEVTWPRVQPLGEKPGLSAGPISRNARTDRRSRVKSAIGMRYRTIDQRSLRAIGGSFNMPELFHQSATGSLGRMRVLAAMQVFAVAPGAGVRRALAVSAR